MNIKLALCNIFPDAGRLKEFAHMHGFSGIDWSFDLDNLPATPMEQTKWIKNLAALAPFEIRYHCPFHRLDLGHSDPAKAHKADSTFRRMIRLVSEAGGKYLTIHIGLGRNSTIPLSWETTQKNLMGVVQYGTEHEIKICLENLAWGWTSRPDLFEKMIRKSGAGVTFDFGHALVSESVRSQQFAIEDFITPHAGNVLNAHIYHTEVSGQGHLPPENLEDINGRLDLLRSSGCQWWAIEIKELESLIQTQRLIHGYLSALNENPQVNTLKKDRKAVLA